MVGRKYPNGGDWCRVMETQDTNLPRLKEGMARARMRTVKGALEFVLESHFYT